MWLLLLLPIVPIALILAVFLLAHKRERHLPFIERKLSLSLWVGLFSLIPGLIHVEHRSAGSMLAFSLESGTEIRGWPLYWWGYTGIGLLWAPLSFLADMGLVAGIALICFSLVGLLDRRIPDRVSKKDMYPLLALAIGLTPLWGAPLLDAYNAYREDEWYQQREAWLDQNAESVINFIQLEQCSNFALVPSTEHPGIMNIKVSVTIKVNEPYEFEIHAEIQEMADDGIVTIVRDGRGWQPSQGMHTIEFILHPISVVLERVDIHRPGPYQIVVFVRRINRLEGGYYQSFMQTQFDYARESLGISGDNLRLECESPPYTLADLGLPIEPTSEP